MLMYVNVLENYTDDLLIPYMSKSCYFIVLKRDLFVHRDDSLTCLMRTEQPTKWFVPLQKLRARLCT